MRNRLLLILSVLTGGAGLAILLAAARYDRLEGSAAASGSLTSMFRLESAGLILLCLLGALCVAGLLWLNRATGSSTRGNVLMVAPLVAGGYALGILSALVEGSGVVDLLWHVRHNPHIALHGTDGGILVLAWLGIGSGVMTAAWLWHNRNAEA